MLQVLHIASLAYKIVPVGCTFLRRLLRTAPRNPRAVSCSCCLSMSSGDGAVEAATAAPSVDTVQTAGVPATDGPGRDTADSNDKPVVACDPVVAACDDAVAKEHSRTQSASRTVSETGPNGQSSHGTGVDQSGTDEAAVGDVEKAVVEDSEGGSETARTSKDQVSGTELTPRAGDWSCSSGACAEIRIRLHCLKHPLCV